MQHHNNTPPKEKGKDPKKDLGINPERDQNQEPDEYPHEQVLNEEEQQNPVNPTDTEGDSRGAFLDLHGQSGPGDEDDEEDDEDTDEDAGTLDPGTEIDIPYPDSEDEASDTRKKIPSF